VEDFARQGRPHCSKLKPMADREDPKPPDRAPSSPLSKEVLDQVQRFMAFGVAEQAKDIVQKWALTIIGVFALGFGLLGVKTYTDIQGKIEEQASKAAEKASKEAAEKASKESEARIHRMLDEFSKQQQEALAKFDKDGSEERERAAKSFQKQTGDALKQFNAAVSRGWTQQAK
jgi:hypothetical protein